MRNKSRFVYASIFVSLVFLVSACQVWAVSSKITRQSSSNELLKGKTDGTVIDSDGTIQLGRAAKTIVEKFKDVWSINSIVVNGETIFIGTSPNGGVYKYSAGQLTKIYPAQSDEPAMEDTDEPDDANADDANAVEVEKYLSNEHIFAMGTDITGRLLVGISGDNCKLMRLEKDQMMTIFEPNEKDAKYIFAINVSDTGDIYLGTGPEGKIYKLDSFGKNPEMMYDSTDKNILCLASGKDGFVYAGSDSRGLIYKINPKDKTATVLYDSEQPEITALLVGENGELFAAATSAKIVAAQTDFAEQLSITGRPEVKSEKPKSKGGLKLNIANTKKNSEDKTSEVPAMAAAPAKPGKASYIYKITSEGFVTEVFSQPAVLFALAQRQQELLVGTGNGAELFSIDPVEQQNKMVYKNEQASQITAVVLSGEYVYLGTSNPAKLVRLDSVLEAEGEYSSELIDAGQPAKWGKLQIDADIPDATSVSVASRSGNVKDVNDPTFSPWTKLVKITEPVQLTCPAGRFCQYKLVLKTSDSQVTPIIREIAVASTVPNLVPRVEAVFVARSEPAGEKKGFFKISYKALDDNSDKLIYKIDLRKTGRTNWIKVKDDVEKPIFEWDGKTVEDGRYEIRVTADDSKGNSPTTKLTGSRISDPFVVDNTGPAIAESSVEKDGRKAILKLKVKDQFSAISKLEYAVDSNEKWQDTIPNDLVYDTTVENFVIVTDELKTGDHIITIKVADDVGNITYKTFEID